MTSVRVFKAKPAPNSSNTQMGDSRATGVEGSKGLLKQNEGNQLLPGANATPATQPSWEPRQLQLQLATWEGGTGCCSAGCKGMLIPPPPQQVTGSSSPLTSTSWFLLILCQKVLPTEPLGRGLQGQPLCSHCCPAKPHCLGATL